MWINFAYFRLIKSQSCESHRRHLCSLFTHLPFIICWLFFPSSGPVRQNRVASVPQISFELGRRGWQPVVGCQRLRAPAVDTRVDVCAPSKCRWRAVNQPLSRGTSLGLVLRGAAKKRGEDNERRIGMERGGEGEIRTTSADFANSEQKLPRACVSALVFRP